MEIPRELLDQLTSEVNALSAAGQQMVMNAIDNAQWSTVAELREVVARAMDMVCSSIADDSASRSAVFYDEVRKEAVGSASGATSVSGYSPLATEGAVRALVQSVVDTGTTDRLRSDLSDRVDYEAKRASEHCISYNCGRDPLKPKYARVPSGAETCPFCLMIASFGFHYSKDTGHNHPNCDCRAVPGFDGMTVGGYDPEGMYRRYDQCLKTLGGRDSVRSDWRSMPDDERKAYVAKHGGSESDAFEKYLEKRVSNEIGTRDPGWFRDGAIPEIDYQKPREAMTGYETRCVDAMNAEGSRSIQSKKMARLWQT